MYKYLDSLTPNQQKLYENNNPYEIGERIWATIKDNFKAYKVEVSQSFPTSPVKQNLIAWRILNRTPGTGKDNQFQAKGKQASGYLGKTEDGLVLEEYTQTMQIDLQFGVFSSSSAEANRIAWDLEQAVINSRYYLQSADSQIQIVFQRQSAQDTYQFRNQDDLIAQYITFRVVLPIRSIDAKPEIRQIELAFRDGMHLAKKEQTRNSSSETFLISANGQPIDGVSAVSIYKNSKWVPIKNNVDYKIERKPNSEDVLLTWIPTGLNPQIGEQFRVEFVYFSNNMHVLLDDTK